jgi:hypothetical protein
MNLTRTIPAVAKRAESPIAKAIELLEIFPFSCRKAMGGSGSPCSAN